MVRVMTRAALDAGTVARPTDDRSTWVALIDEGLRARLTRSGVDEHLHVVDDPADFAGSLVRDRPRIALVSAPPACPDDLEIAVRERRRRSGLRLLYLSPTDDVDGRIDALRLGFDEALPSTLDVRELLGRIRWLAERAKPGTDTEFAIADGIVLDTVAHELRHDDKSIHLRPKEFQLLALLAAHPGRVYTRRQLLDRVWGPGHVGDPRTVDVHVRWLRSKIELQPDAPLHLVTVRGVGYRLDPDPR
jgi:two-component system response regulator RegX3